MPNDASMASGKKQNKPKKKNLGKTHIHILRTPPPHQRTRTSPHHTHTHKIKAKEGDSSSQLGVFLWEIFHTKMGHSVCIPNFITKKGSFTTLSENPISSKNMITGSIQWGIFLFFLNFFFFMNSFTNRGSLVRGVQNGSHWVRREEKRGRNYYVATKLRRASLSPASHP